MYIMKISTPQFVLIIAVVIFAGILGLVFWATDGLPDSDHIQVIDADEELTEREFTDSYVSEIIKDKSSHKVLTGDKKQVLLDCPDAHSLYSKEEYKEKYADTWEEKNYFMNFVEKDQAKRIDLYKEILPVYLTPNPDKLTQEEFTDLDVCRNISGIKPLRVVGDQLLWGWIENCGTNLRALNEQESLEVKECIKVADFLDQFVEDAVEPENMYVVNSSAIDMITDITKYQAVTDNEFSTYDSCLQSKLHNDATTAKKLLLFESDRFNVIIYATPNVEKFNNQQFHSYVDTCGELGAKSPLAIVEGYQLWWSQLGCGFEVGEFFGNETKESKECQKISGKVLEFRKNNY